MTNEEHANNILKKIGNISKEDWQKAMKERDEELAHFTKIHLENARKKESTSQT